MCDAGGYDWFCCFKQKTAYEMRIRDWSSDVCSSDLEPERRAPQQLGEERVDGGVGNELLPDARVVKRFDLYREGAQIGTVPDRLARARIDDAPIDENVHIPLPKTANRALSEHDAER